MLAGGLLASSQALEAPPPQGGAAKLRPPALSLGPLKCAPYPRESWSDLTFGDVSQAAPTRAQPGAPRVRLASDMESRTCCLLNLPSCNPLQSATAFWHLARYVQQGHRVSGCQRILLGFDQAANWGGREADLLVAQLAAAMPIDVMAGAADPANQALPQQALHACLFAHAAAYPALHRRAAPAPCNHLKSFVSLVFVVTGWHQCALG